MALTGNSGCDPADIDIKRSQLSPSLRKQQQTYLQLRTKWNVCSLLGENLDLQGLSEPGEIMPVLGNEKFPSIIFAAIKSNGRKRNNITIL